MEEQRKAQVGYIINTILFGRVLVKKFQINVKLNLCLFYHILVWGTQQWTRHLIMKQMTEYILKRHLSLSSDDIVQLVDQLDFSLIYGDKGIN